MQAVFGSGPSTGSGRVFAASHSPSKGTGEPHHSTTTAVPDADTISMLPPSCTWMVS